MNKPTKDEMDKPAKATHKEICDQALVHYEKISVAQSEWNSVVPKAILFYRDYAEKHLIEQSDKPDPDTQELVEDILALVAGCQGNMKILGREIKKKLLQRQPQGKEVKDNE